MTGSQPALRGRDFRLLWLGEAVSNTGSAAGRVALPLVALTVTHASAFAVTLLTAAAWLPWLLIGLPAGAWVDRLARRPVMIAADLVSAAAFLSAVVAAACGVLSTAQLIGTALVGGCAQVLFATACRAFLPGLVRPAELTAANAALLGSEQAANLAGPGVAGLLAQSVGAVGGVLLDALSFLVSATCLHRIRTPERALTRARRPLRREIVEGWRTTWGDEFLRWNVAFGSVGNFALTGYQSVLVVFLVRDIGLSVGLTGALIALTSLGGLAGAALAQPLARRLGRARAVLIVRCVTSPFALLIALTTPGMGLGWFLMGSSVLFLGITVGNVVMSGFVQAYVPRELFGRVSSSSQVVNFGAIPLGAVCAGALAAATDVHIALTVMLALVVVSVGVLLAGPMRRRRELPTAMPRRDAPARAVGVARWEACARCHRPRRIRRARARNRCGTIRARRPVTRRSGT